MYTLEDLQAAIGTLADDAPDVDRLLTSLHDKTQPRHAFRRVIAVTVSVVLIVAVSVALALTGRDHHASGKVAPAVVDPGPTTDHPCTGDARTGLMNLSLGPVDGVGPESEFGNISACPGFATRGVYNLNGGILGSVTLFAPGVFDESEIANATPVQGAGVDGYVLRIQARLALGMQVGGPNCLNPAAPARPPSCTGSATDPGGGEVPAVVWEYAPAAWGLAVHTPGDDAIPLELKIAAATRREGQGVGLPFALSALPAGTVPLRVSADYGTKFSARAAGVELGVIGQDPTCPANEACTQIASVDVVASNETQTAPGWPGQHEVVNGYPLTIVDSLQPNQGARVLMATGHWYVDMDTRAGSGLTADDLVSIARAMTFAPSAADLSTWFTLDQAFPR
jgi:hypothetical protein